MRGVLKNERGLTLLEVLISLVIILLISAIYVTYMHNYIIQKEGQKSKIRVLNEAVGGMESQYKEIKEGNFKGELPYREVKEKKRGGKNYTVNTTIEEVKVEEQYQKGDLLEVKVEVTDGKKAEEVTTYVYKE